MTDVPLAIRLTGFEPYERVMVRAQTRGDDFGRAWASFAVFETDGHGSVDLAQQAPLAGSHENVDPMGLIWSMELDPAAEEECYFRKRTLDSMQIGLSAEVDSEVVAGAQVERLFLAPGETRVEVSEEGLVGVFFGPPGPGLHPGVIVLGGADGGILEHGAALLAARGYAALALGYFGTGSLPSEPREIPLEYFGRAVGWLRARPQVDGDAVSLIGTSLGGLFGLLAAVTYPDIRVVVGYVALGIVMGTGPKTGLPSALTDIPCPSYR